MSIKASSGSHNVSIQAGWLWFAGWLFTIGYVGLHFWKGVLALIIWPYYLGAELTGPG